MRRNIIIVASGIIANIIIGFAINWINGSNNIESYINNLFYIGIAYCFIGGSAVVGSYLAPKSFNYQQANSVSGEEFSKRNNLDNILLNKNIIFCIKMMAIGITTFMISYLITIIEYKI